MTNPRNKKYPLLPATAQARATYLQTFRDADGLLSWSGSHKRQLQQVGLCRPACSLEHWNDKFNRPINNGHTRTVAHMMFDLLVKLPAFQAKDKTVVWLGGPPGRGKTHLAMMAMSYYCLFERKSAQVMNWPSFWQQYTDGFSGDMTVRLAPLYQTDVLLIDDLTTDVTKWRLQQLYNMLEARKERALTIITSNRRIAVDYTTIVKERPVTFVAWGDAIFRPQRKKDQQDADYPVIAAQIWDRLQPGRGGEESESYLIVDLAITASNSYREPKGKP